jgi:pimeloyl-ACP methyl ester carboxylesterase
VSIARTGRRARLRLIIPALVMAVAALIIPLSLTASAHATTRAAAGAGPKPTIVLEHGAWADTSSWNGVIKRLQADGYTVYAPPNPLQGLTYDSAFLADFLHSISGPIVLVGHSYGGAVITNAATGDPQVKALVYVDAFAPAQGQTLARLLASVPGSCAVPANLNVVPLPGAPAGDGDAYITQSAFPSCMANGLPAREADRHRGPRHPAGAAVGHGRERARPHHRGQRPAPVHDLRPGRRDQRHSAGRASHHLTTEGARPTPGWRPG